LNLHALRWTVHYESSFIFSFWSEQGSAAPEPSPRISEAEASLQEDHAKGRHTLISIKIGNFG